MEQPPLPTTSNDAECSALWPAGVSSIRSRTQHRRVLSWICIAKRSTCHRSYPRAPGPERRRFYASRFRRTRNWPTKPSVKTAMVMLGQPAGKVRLPLTPLQPETREILCKTLQDLGKI